MHERIRQLFVWSAIACSALVCWNTNSGILPAPAQMPAAPGGVEATGPVDIQANEQEFSGDQILAKGNVKVTYKDTVILSPEATLVRNEGGSPQSAVFTGHPRLVQKGSAMDSDELMFDIVKHKILAQGHAHSEVISESSGPPPPPQNKPGTKSGATSKTAETSQGSPSTNANDAAVEKIITDSDRQEYDQSSDKFEAFGHVRVRHTNIKVTSDKLQLVYGADKKPETAIFIGTAVACQAKNETHADVITYNLVTRRLQATGHVRSKVIQEKAEAAPTKNSQRPEIAYGSDAAAAASLPATAASSTASSKKRSDGGLLEGGVSAKEEDVIILSDSQDYNKQSGRIFATGNVKVYYEDSIGSGPAAIVIRGDGGKAEKVVFIGRSQVTQPHKWWIGDNITLMVASKKVIAQGNTRAYVERMPPNQLKKQDKNEYNKEENNSQLATRSNAAAEISAARVEATR
jgi:lipopolysaccharide assembly outer membrane protein LptD (OstA)